MSRRSVAVLVIAALGMAACSSDSGDATSPTEGSPSTLAVALATTSASTTGAPTTTAAATTTAVTVSDVRAIVETMASDEFDGRANGSPGSEAARRYLIDRLSAYAQPVYADRPGDAGFVQTLTDGTNVLALIPGGELSDEYVVVGAHYDHLGRSCATSDPADQICNGATDNATGVAAALTIGRTIAAAGPPRRSVLLAFWDREEDDLSGSSAFVADPPVPLASITAYVNFDIQGSDLLPSLADTTVIVGAETGGPNLGTLVAAAADAAVALEPVRLSLLFGQGRSDHAVFVAAGVPSVFFTDANNACYHTAQDDLRAVDFAKLDHQIAMVTEVTQGLVETDTPPQFDPDAPATIFDDAVSMLAVTTKALPDIGLLEPEAQDAARVYLTALQAMVDAGPAAFDDAAVGTLLAGAVTFVDALRHGECRAAPSAG